MTKQPTQQRVIEDYFRTTSAASVTEGGMDAASLDGWRRRLGPWLDVAGKDVVDLGCGLGDTCRLCAEAGAASVVGVNLSKDELDFARQHADADFVHQDIEAYLNQREPVSVDRIFALNILEHLDKDTLVRVLDAAHRALRPGGTLVAMVPNATSPFGCMTRYWDITHFNAFTPSSFRQLARLCGFSDVIELRECAPVPHGVTSSIRYLLWQGIRQWIKFRLLIEMASTKGGVYTADMLVRMHKRETARE